MVDRAAVRDWIERYERAWRTAGTRTLDTLFTHDATYSTAPYTTPHRGLAEIAKLWEAERESHAEVFTIRTDVVAIENDTGVVRVEVQYGEPVQQEWRDLWIVTFARDGRCRAFEEWPFAPPDAPG